MNSMFSVFDALCAELMGKKVTPASASASASSPGKAVQGCFERNAAASSDRTASQKTEDATKKKARLLQKTPRFAPELDGLHCFETIIAS